MHAVGINESKNVYGNPTTKHPFLWYLKHNVSRHNTLFFAFSRKILNICWKLGRFRKTKM